MSHFHRFVLLGCLGCLGLFPTLGFSAPDQPTAAAQESSAQPPATTPREPKSEPRVLVTFAAMGDVPRSREEEGLLVRQLAQLPADVEFVVHLGDIKAGSTPCDERTYLKVAGLLATSQVPVLIVPGDNEWNDCPQPDCAWQHWQNYFSHFERHWPPRFTLTRASQRDELFSFVQGNVLFIGLNLVGGQVHNSLEWELRHADNGNWTSLNFHHYGAIAERVVVLGHARPTENQADYFRVLVKESQAYGKPVLYLHGDGHRWSQRHPWEADNLLAVQVDQGALGPPVKVTVTDQENTPFVFDRRLEKKAK